MKNDELKPCPFCGGRDIKYSTKSNHRGRKLQYHASYYCNTCHCYGSRVLSQNVEQRDYKTRREMEKSETLKNNARLLWNVRV